VQVPVAARQVGRGSLTLGFDMVELQGRLRETRALILAAALLLLLVGLPAAFALGSFVVAPLGRMTAVAGRVAEGDAGARAELPLDRADELGRLARAFSHMLDRLYEKEAGLSTLAANLEARVARRTGDLERANREIAEQLAQIRRTQEQLVVADRRITMGRLVAGIAHEINNPLAYVRANLDFLNRTVRELLGRLDGRPGDAQGLKAEVSELAEAASDALQGVGRVQHIVRGLKTYSRDDAGANEPVSLKAALKAAIDMSSHEVKGRARLTVRLGDLPEVMGHEVRLSQVFVNLIVNAAQAIPESAPERNEVRVTALTDAAGQAVVEVRDTGSGMSAEVCGRLFEPFFTTKPLGSGTGLGLSISLDIVKRSGGSIDVESAPGQGSTFRVRLPPARQRAVPVPPEPASAPACAQRLRLLVVDDEPGVRAALERSLGREHEVVSAESGRAALARLAAGERFDRILCDLSMPEMGGIAFHRLVAGLDPATAASIVFMTGGVLSDASRGYLAAQAAVCLEKPLDPEALGNVLDACPR